MLSEPNVASQKGLVEMFDSTVGRSTVLMPYGGSTQSTETQVSLQKLPTDGYTDTASVMAFGYNPRHRMEPLSRSRVFGGRGLMPRWSPPEEWSRMRFSYQEYFERMTHDPHSWGKPLSALLGALKMQLALGLPSIGGKRLDERHLRAHKRASDIDSLRHHDHEGPRTPYLRSSNGRATVSIS